MSVITMNGLYKTSSPKKSDFTVQSNGLYNISQSDYTLMLKYINFYRSLITANQKISEGKQACPVSITWDPHNANKTKFCGLQIRVLLRTMNKSDDNNLGYYIELYTNILQYNKMNKNRMRNGKSPIQYI